MGRRCPPPPVLWRLSAAATSTTMTLTPASISSPPLFGVIPLFQFPRSRQQFADDTTPCCGEGNRTLWTIARVRRIAARVSEGFSPASSTQPSRPLSPPFFYCFLPCWVSPRPWLLCRFPFPPPALAVCVCVRVWCEWFAFSASTAFDVSLRVGPFLGPALFCCFGRRSSCPSTTQVGSSRSSEIGFVLAGWLLSL